MTNFKNSSGFYLSINPISSAELGMHTITLNASDGLNSTLCRVNINVTPKPPYF
jgi:hypothetical protein